MARAPDLIDIDDTDSHEDRLDRIESQLGCIYPAIILIGLGTFFMGVFAFFAGCRQ